MITWTDDQLADYETALETIGNAIAVASRDISKEREKSRPDVRRIDELLELQKRLSDGVCQANCVTRFFIAHSSARVLRRTSP
ncbi:hypothetical protein BRO09_17025, partial [Xanthomonas oryzae pv. oryzae]